MRAERRLHENWAFARRRSNLLRRRHSSAGGKPRRKEKKKAGRFRPALDCAVFETA
jgi:hypothetical protein